MANIKDWPLTRIARAESCITACIQRIVDEVPERLTVDWLLGEVRAGRQDLWVAYDETSPDEVVMVAFTEILHYLATGYTFMKIVGLGGRRLDELLPLLDELEEWGRRNGAQSVEIVGREGWSRRLKARGYEHKSTSVAKALSKE